MNQPQTPLTIFHQRIRTYYLTNYFSLIPTLKELIDDYSKRAKQNKSKANKETKQFMKYYPFYFSTAIITWELRYNFHNPELGVGVFAIERLEEGTDIPYLVALDSIIISKDHEDISKLHLDISSWSLDI